MKTFAPTVEADGFTLVKPLNLLQRMALTSYDIHFPPSERDVYQGKQRYPDGIDGTVLGILPVLKQFIIDEFDHATYDLGISLKMLGDDHPRLRAVLHWLSERLERLS